MATPHGQAAARTAPAAGWAMIAALAIGNAGLWAAFFGPIELLLAQQAAAIAPADKVAVLGVVSAAGAGVAMVANPLFGALSDRTRGRLGRRRPWMLAGAAGGAASLVLLAQARDVAGMVMGWCLAQAALNAMFTALVAVIADRVPPDRRGTVGAWLALAQTGGVIGGVALAGAAPDYADGYLACAAAVLAGALPCLAIGDAGLRPPHDPRPGRDAHSQHESIPADHLPAWRSRDARWAWLVRFLLNLTSALGLLYLLYFLTDGVHRPAPAGDVLHLTIVYVAAMTLMLLPAGFASDRIGRRRPFVVAAGVVTGTGMALLALMPHWDAVLAGVALIGAGFGLYTAVDVAIVTQVLPRAADAARDLGLFNIANSLPQVLAPALAGLLVGGFGYPVLYGVGAVLALAAAAAVGRIAKVG